MVRVAFYKGKGTWFDKGIRWWTRSPYSHVELVMGEVCYSSSPRDGGVRDKIISLGASWEVAPVPWLDQGRAVEIYETHRGEGYDFTGIVTRQVFNAPLDKRSRWFCSEFVAHCLGLPNPSKYSPGDLHELLTTGWMKGEPWHAN